MLGGLVFPGTPPAEDQEAVMAGTCVSFDVPDAAGGVAAQAKGRVISVRGVRSMGLLVRMRIVESSPPTAMASLDLSTA